MSSVRRVGNGKLGGRMGGGTGSTIVRGKNILKRICYESCPGPNVFSGQPFYTSRNYPLSTHKVCDFFHNRCELFHNRPALVKNFTSLPKSLWNFSQTSSPSFVKKFTSHGKNFTNKQSKLCEKIHITWQKFHYRDREKNHELSLWKNYQWKFVKNLSSHVKKLLWKNIFKTSTDGDFVLQYR